MNAIRFVGDCVIATSAGIGAGFLYVSQGMPLWLSYVAMVCVGCLGVVIIRWEGR